MKLTINGVTVQGSQEDILVILEQLMYVMGETN